MINVHTMMPPVLEDGVEAHIDAGEMDYVCNWCGKNAVIVAEEEDCTLDGKVVAACLTRSLSMSCRLHCTMVGMEQECSLIKKDGHPPLASLISATLLLRSHMTVLRRL